MNTKLLKQKILDLAIRGKLVPQDPNDEPASVLLERIRKEREQLIAQGKIKRPKTTSDNRHYENMPFEIPESWEWVKLDEVAQYKKGPFGSSLTKAMFVPDGAKVFKVYEQKNAIQKDASLGNYYISSSHFEKLKGFEVFPNDIIVSCAGTIGETYVIPNGIKRGIINQALMYIRLHLPAISPFYLIYFDTIIKGDSNKDSKGTAIKNIPPFEVLKQYLFPLPPLSEQNRIVEEVKKWFSIIDELEKDKTELQYNIRQTKSKILELALQGSLVPQDPNDEPAIELLKRIVPDFTPSDNPHYPNLPEGWCVVKVGDIYNHTTGKALKRANTDGVLREYLTTSNVYWNTFDFFDVRSMYFTENELEKCTVHKGDLLVCNGGDVGRAAIWDYDYDICIQNHISRLRAKSSEVIDNVFCSYIFMYLKNRGLLNGKGVAITSLSATDLLSIPIPLPPIKEQKRIVQAFKNIQDSLDEITEEL